MTYRDEDSFLDQIYQKYFFRLLLKDFKILRVIGEKAYIKNTAHDKELIKLIFFYSYFNMYIYLVYNVVFNPE